MAKAHRSIAAVALARSEWPFATLCLLALLSPIVVLAQGGEWTLAVLACLGVLAAPGAALEAMLGLARATLWLEGSGAGS